MRLGYSALLLFVAVVARAQDPLPPTDSLGPYGRAVQSWIGLRVSPGREAQAMQRIREQLPGWSTGALGSLVRSQGSGSPHRVVACGIDATAYVVSNITDDGYLRVHMAGSRSRPPMWHAMHVGQRVLVLKSSRGDAERVRAVPGVFGVRSTHLWRRMAGVVDSTPTLEDLWIDVGARSAGEVASLGIRVLDPVFRDMPDWSVGDAVVGPDAAARAGCAAVAAAAALTPASGQTTFVISTQSSFDWAALSAVLRGLSDVDSIYVAAPDSQRVGRRLRVRSQFPGTLVEVIRETDLAAYFDEVARAAGISGSSEPVHAVLLSPSLRAPQPTDSLTRYAELLSRFTDTYAVSGDEGPMRDMLRARLPAWARDKIVVDTSGNVVLSMGPDRDTTAFVAHMDEVGFEVVRVQNGIATLRSLGGFYPWLFMGQPALLHVPIAGEFRRSQGCRPTSGTAIRGVFLPPDSANRSTREVQAWFGDEATAMGGVAGLRVTSFKCATRLAQTRYTARSIDDRLGSAALVLALDGIDTTKLTHKVIFVWSVREETSLGGARGAAADFGASVKRVHAVDTFVSADSPLETGRFAVVPIGSGAVVRALDNSSVTPPDEIERVARIARASGIPLQVSTTNGGNDGSVFVPYGAVDVPVSWPLRYSHSPAEVIDLRDMRSLARLISALAMASVR